MRANHFNKLTAFVAVAEQRNFARAATQLGIKASALSQSIRSLEEELGVRLLNRTTRSVAPTEAGVRVLGYMRPALESIGKALDAVSDFRDKPMGTLRLVVPSIAAMTVVARALPRFLAAYPDIKLEISVDDARSDIVGERFDAGVRFDGQVERDMIAVPIGGEFRGVVAASPAYLAQHLAPSTPDDLHEHNCIRYRRAWDGAVHDWRFEHEGEELEAAVEGSLIVNNFDLALRAALDGVGLVYLPEEWAAPFIAEGRLIAVLQEWRPRWPGFSLYYSSRRQVPPALRALADFMRKEASQPEPATTQIDPRVFQKAS
jgi:DNA-binding transcriptional LysR family regulator